MARNGLVPPSNSPYPNEQTDRTAVAAQTNSAGGSAIKLLTPAQIYSVARAAGFPPVLAVTMTAIAMRESAGNPDAFNGDAKTGDRSYGLWQINMFEDTLREHRMKLFDIADEKDLFDPAANARAAFLLWGGHNKNLSIAWYIDHGGDYQERYEKHLPAAQAAALAAIEK